MRPANDLDYMPSNRKAFLRKEIVRMMAIRAGLTGRAHAEAWKKVDKEICDIQRQLDQLEE